MFNELMLAPSAPSLTPAPRPRPASVAPSPSNAEPVASVSVLVDVAVARDRVVGDLGIFFNTEVHYKTLCSTLTTLPGVTTPQLLLDAALRVTATKAGVAEMRLDEALKSPKAKGTAMSSSLQSCKDSYASLVGSLQSARNTLKSGGSHADVMSELSAAGTFSTDCEDIFDERPELQSPIPGAQRHVSRLVSNCLDLAATIKQH